MQRKGNNNIRIGILGFGYVGKAIHFGMGTIMPIFRIYDANAEKSVDTLVETALDTDFIFIAVPTPSKENGECDISIVESVIHSINDILKTKNDKIIIIKSTIPPGTTDRLIKMYPNLNIIFNPEFLTEKNYRNDFINPGRIILGGEKRLTSKVKELYKKRFTCPIIETTAKTAELAKYANNAMLTVKIGFCNELYDICQNSGIDYNEIKQLLLLDGRISNSHMDVPGSDGQRGFGGTCFPKDINAFIKYSEEIGIDPIIMKSVLEKNLKIRKT